MKRTHGGKKSIAIAIFATLMVATFTGCGESNGSSETVSTPASSVVSSEESVQQDSSPEESQSDSSIESGSVPEESSEVEATSSVEESEEESSETELESYVAESSLKILDVNLTSGVEVSNVLPVVEPSVEEASMTSDEVFAQMPVYSGIGTNFRKAQIVGYGYTIADAPLLDYGGEVSIPKGSLIAFLGKDPDFENYVIVYFDYSTSALIDSSCVDFLPPSYTPDEPLFDHYSIF